MELSSEADSILQRTDRHTSTHQEEKCIGREGCSPYKTVWADGTKGACFFFAFLFSSAFEFLFSFRCLY